MTAVHFLERAVSVTLQAGLIVAVTYWLCRGTDDERTRCRLWSLCSLLLMADLAAAFLLPHLRLFQPWTVVSTTMVSELFVLERQAGRVVFVVWLCGALGAAGLLAAQSVRMLRFLRSCQPLDENLLPPLADDTSALPSAAVDRQRTGIVPILLQSPALPVPVCWQWHRPCIVLPSDLLSLSDRDLTFILRHEYEHLRTGHPLQVFLQRLVEIVFWFHPMVWWASRQAALSREFLCDDAAIGEGGDVASYLRTMVRLVERFEPGRDPAPGVLSFGGRTHMIVERSDRLARRAEQTSQSDEHSPFQRPGPRRPAWLRVAAQTGLAVLAMSVSVPVNVTASPRSVWSPWPTWSAAALHDVGVTVRDYEVYDRRLEIQDLIEHHAARGAGHPRNAGQNRGPVSP